MGSTHSGSHTFNRESLSKDLKSTPRKPTINLVNTPNNTNEHLLRGPFPLERDLSPSDRKKKSSTSGLLFFNTKMRLSRQDLLRTKINIDRDK